LAVSTGPSTRALGRAPGSEGPAASSARARHRRPIETNQAAASSACPCRAARHPRFRSDPSTSAKVTANLPYWHRHRPLTRCHGPDRRRHARCGSPPGRPAARIPRYAHDASSCRPAPPSGRVNRRTGHAPHPHADGRIHAWRHLGRTGSAPAVGPGGRCRRYGVPTGPRWAAWAARGRYFVRVTKVRGASDGRFTSGARHDLTGAWLDHQPPHVLPCTIHAHQVAH
jgi:hypothetical protein